MEGRRNTTVRQMELLVEFLKNHKDLALGRVRSREARAVAARLWRECTLTLNAEGPARTPKEWSKVWNDTKFRVRGKLVNINTNLEATGGGPSNAPTLTPLEDQVANILGRDIGPLPNVRQDHFASQDDERDNDDYDGEERHEEIEEWVVPNESESLQLQINDQNVQSAQRPRPDASPTPSISGQAPSPTQSQIERANTRRTRQRARRRTAARQSAAPPAPAQSNRTALDEARSIVLKIESTRAEAALKNAEAAKTLADGFKLLSESVDRFSRVFAQQQAPEEHDN